MINERLDAEIVEEKSYSREAPVIQTSPYDVAVLQLDNPAAFRTRQSC
jgi:hypothetical protein